MIITKEKLNCLIQTIKKLDKYESGELHFILTNNADILSYKVLKNISEYQSPTVIILKRN